MIVWVIIYSYSSKEKRKEMLTFSLWISLFGFTQPLWVPEYWKPQSIFSLPFNFDIESVIFSFSTGGIAVVVYNLVFPSMVKSSARGKRLVFSLLLGPVTFIFLLFTAKINHIYSAIIAMTIGGLISYFVRPELRRRMLTSLCASTIIYFAYFVLLIAMFPGYVERVWNLKALWGIFIFGVPLEELIFAASLGFIWPSIYEYFRERRIM